MKIMRSLGITMLSLALLGWVTACAGTHGKMDNKMDSEMTGTKSMTDKKMDSGMTETKGMMDKKMDPGMPDQMDAKMNGMLTGSDGHHAAGKVAFGMGMNNKQVLTLSDIQVDKVPDGYVFLTKNGDHMHGVELGTLKQFSGTVSFDLPPGVNPDDFDSVVIWCKKFNVEIGRAYLPKKMM